MSDRDNAPILDASRTSRHGRARRRLVQALGGVGGAAVGHAMLNGWQKPVVEAVVLPAHAQTTDTETAPTTPTTCSNELGWTVTVFYPNVTTPSNSGGVRNTLSFGGVPVASASDNASTGGGTGNVPGSSALSVSASTTFDTTGGSTVFGYQVGWDFRSVLGPQNPTISISATCCTGVLASGFAPSGTADFIGAVTNLDQSVVFSTDGQCSFVVT